jgi:hypothetical protein
MVISALCAQTPKTGDADMWLGQVRHGLASLFIGCLACSP